MEKILITIAVLGTIVFAFGPLVHECRRWFVSARRLHVCVILPLVALLLMSCSGGGGVDHTAENWLMLIGLLLCWLKG